MIRRSPSNGQPQLVRVIGRWSMVALALNSILGSGIFGLPSILAALLGAWSPLAVLLGGAATAAIVACYAEVASQFSASGGTYLYIRTAFGRLAGLETAWLMLLGRLTACAGALNLLVAYLAEFWPRAEAPVPRFWIITLLLATLTFVNVRGVGGAARLGNATAVAKLAALLLVIAVGGLYLAHHGAPPAARPPAGVGRWADALLLLLFAYGGYEVALNPMGEARDPRHDAPFALLTALLVVTVLYCALQVVVVAVLPDAAASTRPLAEVARIATGAAGAGVIAAGALVSVYGYLSANLLAVPRMTFALAEARDFPRLFARVHPRWHTPYASIVMFAVVLWACALLGSFTWNITLSAVARLLYYAALCAAVPVLRRRARRPAGFRVRGGLALPIIGIAVCVALGTRVDFSKSLVLLATIGLALGNWMAVRVPGLNSGP